jgi:hypothetical protein
MHDESPLDSLSGGHGDVPPSCRQADTESALCRDQVRDFGCTNFGLIESDSLFFLGHMNYQGYDH